MAYTIKQGDTLSGIAQKNNTTVEQLMKDNPNIKDPNLIYAGQSLSLPSVQPIVSGGSTISAGSISDGSSVDVSSLPLASTKVVDQVMSNTSGIPEFYQNQYTESLKKEEEAKKAQAALGTKPTLSTQDATAKAYETYGVTDLQKKTAEQATRVAALRGEIDKINVLEQQEIDQVRAQMANVPSYVIDRQINEISRKYAPQKAYKAAELSGEAAVLSAYSGNLGEAKSLAKDAVDAYTYDITQQREDFDNLYNLYGDWIESLDQDQQDILKNARAEILNQEDITKKDKTAVMDLSLQYPGAGIKISDTLATAYEKATQWQSLHPQAPETQGNMYWDEASKSWKPISGETSQFDNVVNLALGSAYDSSTGSLDMDILNSTLEGYSAEDKTAIKNKIFEKITQLENQPLTTEQQNTVNPLGAIKIGGTIVQPAENQPKEFQTPTISNLTTPLTIKSANGQTVEIDDPLIKGLLNDSFSGIGNIPFLSNIK